MNKFAAKWFNVLHLTWVMSSFPGACEIFAFSCPSFPVYSPHICMSCRSDVPSALYKPNDCSQCSDLILRWELYQTVRLCRQPLIVLTAVPHADTPSPQYIQCPVAYLGFQKGGHPCLPSSPSLSILLPSSFFLPPLPPFPHSSPPFPFYSLPFSSLPFPLPFPLSPSLPLEVGPLKST